MTDEPTTATGELAAHAEMTEEEFLANYDMSAWPQVAVTCDVVCLTIRQGQVCVLLVERAGHPFRGWWALPGGFSAANETLDETARRELAEETGIGLEPTHIEQLATYGDPGRDPRGHMVTVAYLAMLPDPGPIQAGSDARRAKFFAIDDLDLAGDGNGAGLAFDHARIINDALERAAAKLEYTSLAAAFCDEPFTLAELRRIYEAFWQVPLDVPNFRRKVLTTEGFVVADPAPPAVRSTGRPAQLYRRGDAKILTPPFLRPDPDNETAP